MNPHKSLLLILPLLFIPLLPLHAQQKYALVIGNGAYTTITRLNNPVNDANDMASTLRNLGFQVDLVLNGDLGQMENATVRLKNRLSAASNAYGFFFYAGHGVQSNGENYLIPVDANIASESFLRSKALQIQAVLDELNQAGNALNIVVLDACRDNPFSWSRSASRGLQVVSAQPADSIIVYATSAGRTASDGTGRNGLFTGQLLKNLKIQGLEVSEMLRRTGADVASVSNRQQMPAIYSQFFGTAYLNGPAARTDPPVQPAAAPAQAPPAQTPKPAPATIQPAAQPERPAPANMVRIPGGTFTMGSPSNEAGRYDWEGPQHKVTVSAFNMGKYEVTVGEFRKFVNATGYKTEAEKGDGGNVWTGSKWEKKADANWKNPYISQGENHPVVLVSWNDAVEYCNWLSRQEGLTAAYTKNGTNVSWNRSANGYRLPTEAEWEYACRAGTTTPYWNGSSIGNAGWYSENSGNRTHPVGEKATNGYGLYDVHGNVWEWCWDWYGSYSSGAQTDPAGASSGSYRVLRGGSWYNSAQVVRSAYRYYITPSSRHGYLGFRLVRP